MRNLTKTLAVVSLLAPASAQPLGIGDIKLHSALNQNLNAEIDLILSADESTSDIQVRLASPEKFDEAGVTWSYFLSKIKFDTVIQPDGSVIVKLSSNEALREPFLDFLLEVSWDKGNLYREFTVLIDPPVAYDQPVIPVVQQVKQPEQAVVQDKVVEETELVAAPDKIAVSSYGPTIRTDTLWKIAEKVRPSENISVEQMMIAMYEANPRAFYKENVNALKAGRTLDIPDSEAILKFSKKQAAKLFKQQVNAWRAQAKVAQAEKPVVFDDERVDSQLELVAPVESDVSSDVVVSPKQEQDPETRVSEESEKTADITDDQVVTDSKVDDKSPQQVANLELQARLEKLEQQLEMMQKLLTLKDEQLAALQNQHKTSEVDKVKPAVETQAESQTGIETATPAQKVEVKPKPKPKAKPEPAPVAEPESGFFAEVYYLVVGGIGAALFGVLGWLWWRKRKVEEKTNTESMFVTSSEIRMPDTEGDISSTTLDDSSAYDVGTVGESSFLSEFTPSDFDAFDSDQNEVDPISEADVYLAYGRYQQAEELMRQAIKEQPDRNECKLKLLEIFYANENKEAFEQFTSELVQEGMHNDSSFWPKVVDMGNEIIPDSEVLSATAPTKANFETEMVDLEKPEQQSGEREEDASTPPEVPDLNEVLTEVPDLESMEQDSSNLDFDLNTFSDADTPDNRNEEEASVTEPLESIAFDLNSFSEAEAEETAETPAVPDNDEDTQSIDFDLNIEAENDTNEFKLETGGDTEDSLEEFDFSSMDEPAEGKDETIEDKISDNEEGDFDFNFDFDEESLSGAESAAEEKMGVSDLTDMDEFETKMDLAKAYIDMGDAKAAKVIAEEILEKGNDQQKQTAQTVLDDLK